MEPVRLEVIAPTFEGMGICTVCELVMSEAGVGEHPTHRGLDEYPTDWQEEYRQLLEWVYGLGDRYGPRILIKVIDPWSAEGLLKGLRYRVRRYPIWIVNGGTKIVGWDQRAIEAVLDQAM
jgi:hypothetical protein